MSRAGHAATVASTIVPCRAERRRASGKPASEIAARSRRSDDMYVERALLLWPRLDRAKIRRYAGNPTRIAEIVERRTAQPFEVILAMLTRQAETPLARTESASGFESGAAQTARMAIRIVSDDPDQIDLESLVLA